MPKVLTPRETARVKELLADEEKHRLANVKPKPPGRPIKVRALKLGFYNNLRRREGDVFVLRDSNQFSQKWMVQVPNATPNRVTTGNQDLKRQHDETIGATFGKANVPNPTAQLDPRDPGDGPARSTGDEGDNPIDA